MDYHLYSKKYEDVYSVDHHKEHTLHIDRVSSVTMGFDEYTDFFTSFLKEFYSDLYRDMVRLAWLRRHFLYDGRKIRDRGYSRHLNGLFVKYVRRIIGKDLQIITRGICFPAVESFLDEFYSGFSDGNPFENPEYYKFPFENITLEFLPVVYQMDERMLLLKEADKQKMSYAVFLDFVVNHVCCVNDEVDREKYRILSYKSRWITYYVRNMDKNNRRKK